MPALTGNMVILVHLHALTGDPRRVTFDPRILERNIVQGSKSVPAFFAFEPLSI